MEEEFFGDLEKRISTEMSRIEELDIKEGRRYLDIGEMVERKMAKDRLNISTSWRRQSGNRGLRLEKLR